MGKSSKNGNQSESAAKKKAPKKGPKAVPSVAQDTEVSFYRVSYYSLRPYIILRCFNSSLFAHYLLICITQHNKTEDEEWAHGWTLWTAYRAALEDNAPVDVPKDHPDQKLVEWVQRQQDDYKAWKLGDNSFLSTDGFQMLSRMGFKWDYVDDGKKQEVRKSSRAKKGSVRGIIEEKMKEELNKTTEAAKSKRSTQPGNSSDVATDATPERSARSTRSKTDDSVDEAPAKQESPRRSTRSSPVKVKKEEDAPAQEITKPSADNEGQIDHWDSYYKQLLDYIAPDKSMDDIVADSDLGKWTAEVRAAFQDYEKGNQQSVLTKERVELLEALNFDFYPARKAALGLAQLAEASEKEAAKTTEEAEKEETTDERPETIGKRKAEDTESEPPLKKAATKTEIESAAPQMPNEEQEEDKKMAAGPNELEQQPQQYRILVRDDDGAPAQSVEDIARKIDLSQIEIDAQLLADVKMEGSGDASNLLPGGAALPPPPSVKMEVDTSLLDRSQILKKDEAISEETYTWLTTPGEPFEPSPELRVSALQAEYNKRWHKNFCELVDFKNLHGHTLIPKEYPANKVRGDRFRLWH